MAVMNYHVRVKVFDASAPQASIVGIPYYFNNNIETITAIRGATWQSPDDSTRLNSEEIRTINLNSRYNLKEFTMPNVQDGSVIEYSYQIRRRYIEELPAFYLANRVPTVLAKVSITYPQYLRYNAVIQDFNHPIKHKKVKKPVRESPEIFTNPQPDPIIKEVWTAQNIPAVQEEKYISTLSDYRGKIKFQLSEFGMPRQPLENSWSYVVEEIRQSQLLFETIKSNEKAFQIGKSIRESVPNQKAAQDSIFRYLLKRVTFNGRRAPFSSVEDAAVLAGKEVNQAAINQTLVSMLRGAGIKAFPVLISTRKSGKINKGYPSFFQFNGQLVWSKIDGKTYFMDGSFSYSEPNLIPVETFNQTGLLLTENAYRWLEVNPAKSVFGIEIKMRAELRQDGTLSGRIKSAFRGYPAREVRLQKSNGMSNAAVLKSSLFDGYSGTTFSSITLENLRSFDKSVAINADFSVPDYATVFRGGLQFRPMIVGYLTSNPFSEERRELPVTLDAPENLRLIYIIELPEGLTLSVQPKDQTIRLPGAVLTEQYEVNGQTLRYEFVINIEKKRYSADLYPQLLNLYKRWVQLSKTRWFVE